jgi:dipeptidyl aminopeptidase/acylaminoacyl peptidase
MSLVWFLVILGLSCLIVALVVYFYTLFSYLKKSIHCESIQEEYFKIPIETPDGMIELEARLSRSQFTPTPAPCIILCHGWLSNLNGLKFLEGALTLQGYVVVAYSSRGHGKSGGKREFPAIYKDIINVIDYLQNNPHFGIDTTRMAVIGHSMGGSIALMFAYLDKRVRVSVAMSAIHDVLENFDKKTSPFNLIFWAKIWFKLTRLRVKLKPEENPIVSPKTYLIQPSNTAVFLIHAKNDPAVGFDSFEKNVASLGLPPDHTLIFEKGGHSLFHLESIILSQIIKWLKDSL